MKNKNSSGNGLVSLFLCFALIICTLCFGNKGVGYISSSLNSDNEGGKADENISEAVLVTGFSGGGYADYTVTNTPSDIKTIMNNAEDMYKGFKKSGVIKEEQLGETAETISYGRIKVNNKTDEAADIKKLLAAKPSFGKITKKKPYILIYHTHSTEGYELLDLGWFSAEYNSRTTDKGKSIIRVGDALTDTLEKAGYKVIHDRNIYDKTYNGAYDRSRVAVEKYLKEHPSIVMTLDVHRDAIYYDSKTRCKPTAVINGKKAAQVMIISGCEGDGITSFPKWKENLTFAIHLQDIVERNCEGLMRPIMFCNRKYNMDITQCSLLLEFGTDSNTLGEAVYSAQLIGKGIAELLNKNIG